MFNFKKDIISLNNLSSSLALILVFLLSIFIISKNSILKNNQYTTLGLIIFSGFFYKTELNALIVLSYFFLLLSVRKIYNLQSAKKTDKKLIDIGFWFSVSTILNPINLIFCFTLFFGIYIYHKINFNILFKVFLGYISVLLIAGFYLSLTKEFSLNYFYLIKISENFLFDFQSCHYCPDLGFPKILFPITAISIFSIYIFKFFGSNLNERLKNSFLTLFFLNSIALFFLAEDYTIFLFFPFLVTLIKIISVQRINLFFEIVILTTIMINSYSF
tara:strand:+ start:3197 stop:4018 length:822 start_codon:yes stop_codon:yes gene_type:complete